MLCMWFFFFFNDKTSTGEGGLYLWMSFLILEPELDSPSPNCAGVFSSCEEEGAGSLLGKSLSEGRENEESMLFMPIFSFQLMGLISKGVGSVI